MARGFGATLGVGTTDKIVSALTAHATQRTYSIWTNRRASGGSGFGRMFDKRIGTQAQVELLYMDNAAATYIYERDRVTNLGLWSVAAPALNTWVHVLVTYDAGDVANNPVIYFGGVDQGATRNEIPSGAVLTNTSGYVLGNRANDNLRVWDGQLAEFAVWDRILTAQEIADLAAGANPKSMPTSLVEYIPMLQADDPVTSCVLTDPTVVGTAATAHSFVSQGCAGGASTTKTLAFLTLGVGS